MDAVVDRLLEASLLNRVNPWHLALWLGLASYFLGDDPLLAPLGEAILSA